MPERRHAPPPAVAQLEPGHGRDGRDGYEEDSEHEPEARPPTDAYRPDLTVPCSRRRRRAAPFPAGAARGPSARAGAAGASARRTRAPPTLARPPTSGRADDR